MVSGDSLRIEDFSDVLLAAVDESLERLPEVLDLREAIRSLPEPWRITVYYFWYVGYSHKEIARLLNVSEGAVKQYARRAKLRLYEKLAKDEAEG